MIRGMRAMKKLNREKILKTIAVIVLPGGIPVFLGYTAYQFYKKRKGKTARDSKDTFDDNDEPQRKNS